MVFARHDAWRNHPFISNCWKKPLPGFGIASAIFAGYLIMDGIGNAMGKSDQHEPATQQQH